MGKDYYWVLGIERGASQTQVQMVYQTKIRQLESERYQEAPLLGVQKA